ncbi:TrmH family RNA methyltransferase [Aquimarina sp. W85]|uniref:TrmH family RNA methyltransferase n=1 Tax=Aquimarina rhodophyticola TaxID=3342246 RepID=UPI003670E411
MHKYIQSLQNSSIKYLLQLKEKSRVRRKEKSFLIEGRREIGLAIEGGYLIHQIFYYAAIISVEEIHLLISNHKSSIELIEITKDIFEKVAYRDTTEGILAVAKSIDLHISNFSFSNKNPLFIVAEAPEKPGNIGAILRTADAAQVDGVLIANPKSDLYNPNIIRSSVGCIFTNKIATGTNDEIISFLKNNGINIYGAALEASVPYYTQDYTQSTAIVVGTEATGLTQDWLAVTKHNIIIPMNGVIDSMNVSVAAGILIYEAKRQRGF